MDIKTFEQKLASLLYDQEAHDELDQYEEREQMYRRMIRKNIFSTMECFAPFAHHHDDEKIIRGLICEWLSSGAPQSRIFWQFPIEFSRWLFDHHRERAPYLIDLIHFECLQADVVNSEEDLDFKPLRSLPLCDPLMLNPSCRLGVYHHAVHLVRKDHPQRQSFLEPLFLLLFRERDDCCFRVLDKKIAQAITFIDSGLTINDSLKKLSQFYGQIDEGFIRSNLLNLCYFDVLGQR